MRINATNCVESGNAHLITRTHLLLDEVDGWATQGR